MRRLTGVVVAWASVVLVCSTLVWTVISRSGDSVVSNADTIVAATLSSRETQGPAAVQSRKPLRPKPTPSTTARPSGTPSPTPSSATGTPPPPPAPATVQQTWTGAAGFVTASCSGASIRLEAAGPNAGWHMGVDARGPSLVKVEFQRPDGHMEVRATCGTSGPVFHTESGADG